VCRVPETKTPSLLFHKSEPQVPRARGRPNNNAGFTPAFLKSRGETVFQIGMAEETRQGTLASFGVACERRTVLRTAALKMYDHNYIAVPRANANGRAPIVINNACGSWHRLAETFSFSNARAYIETLFPISTSEVRRSLGD